MWVESGGLLAYTRFDHMDQEKADWEKKEEERTRNRDRRTGSGNKKPYSKNI